MWWHILGVESTSDKATVKKAYAKIIKEVDQDNDIDGFTKIHQAYREAMKSFKEVVETKENEYKYTEYSDEYMNYLDKIYTNKKKRLNPKIWADIFACMSFKEEESFKDKYVEFFNNHYLLIDEIWALVDKQYPLNDQKNFKWIDLYNGSFSLSVEELSKVPKNKQCDYVEDKINIYYNMMNKNNEQALIKIKAFINDYKNNEISQWYMVIAIALKNQEEIECAYERLINNPETMFDGYYQMAGYLTSIGEFAKSKSILSNLAYENDYINRIIDENELGLQGKEGEKANRLPWTELKYCSKKKMKLLSQGNYEKALKLDTSSLLSFINKGGKG